MPPFLSPNFLRYWCWEIGFWCKVKFYHWKGFWTWRCGRYSKVPQVLWWRKGDSSLVKCKVSSYSYDPFCQCCNRQTSWRIQMLYFETVEPGTLSLLKELMTIPELRSFSLVGGTALSLQYGHRGIKKNIPARCWQSAFRMPSLTSLMQTKVKTR